MNLNEIHISAERALESLKINATLEHSTNLDEIIEQITFISKCAKNGKNPRKVLMEGQSFTYSILASREFASPEELELKAKLDKVSRALFPEDYRS